MKNYTENKEILLFLSVTIGLIVNLGYFNTGFASLDNNTSVQSQNIQNMTTNSTNIVLVHGAWADGSSWNKVIPILEKAGHKVLAVQLPEHSLADDVATVQRAMDFVGGPIALVAHSYGGFVITNAAHDNSNVTSLVYIAAFAPDENQSLSDFVDVTTFPENFLIPDKGGFLYINPMMFSGAFAQDVNPTEATTMAIVQKPINLAIIEEKSGPPAWKEIPSWYQISEADHMIPPAAQQQFAKQMNATTLSLNASHSSLVSHPNEIADFILQAVEGGTK